MATEKEQLQPIVNAFAQHLRSQGKPSFNATGGCAYRGLGGTSCGFGGLIADSFYQRQMEGMSAECVRVRTAVRNSGFPNDAISDKAMSLLQVCHDDAPPERFMAALEEKLMLFCGTFGVTYPPAA